MEEPHPVTSLAVGHAYRIAYKCRDIGYGVEAGNGEFVYRGLLDDWGKHEFVPIGGGPTIYLFPDEITSAQEGGSARPGRWGRRLVQPGPARPEVTSTDKWGGPRSQQDKWGRSRNDGQGSGTSQWGR